MKKTVLTTVFFVITMITTQAQTYTEYADLVKSVIKIEVKSYVYDALGLTTEEADAFDPLFNDYLKKAGDVAMKKIKLYDEYFVNYNTMTNEQLDVLNKQAFKTDLMKSKVDKKFYKRFKKRLGINRATTFFFLKKNIDNLIEQTRLKLISQ